MHEPKLPLPNPEDWCDRHTAAVILHVHWRTVERFGRRGILTRYEIGQAVLYWRPEVERVARARIIARGGNHA